MIQKDLSTLLSESDKGNAEAQFNLAKRYEEGNGIAKNEKKAAALYKRKRGI